MKTKEHPFGVEREQEPGTLVHSETGEGSENNKSNLFAKLKNAAMSRYAAGVITLLAAAGTTTSCKKDCPDTPTEQIDETPAAVSVGNVDATENSLIFGNISIVDAESELGDVTYSIVQGADLKVGPIALTSEQKEAAAAGVLNLEETGLLSDTEYKLKIHHFDAAGNEGNYEKLAKTLAEAEANYTYEVETEVVLTFTEWKDKIDGNKIPAGTVVATLHSDIDIKKDGETDNTQSTETIYTIEGEDQALLNIVGNKVQFVDDTNVDNQITGKTEAWVENGLRFSVKTSLQKEGEEKAYDLDPKAINVIDEQDMYWFKNQAGNPVYIENTNGQKYQDAIDARHLYNTQTGETSMNSGAKIAFASNADRFDYVTPVVDGQNYPNVQITDGGTHHEKYIAIQQQEEIAKVIGAKGVEHGVYANNDNHPFADMGHATNQVPDENWVTNTATSVKVDHENAEKLAEHGVLTWYEKNGINPQ